MRRSRDELAKDIDKMIVLRNQNKTYRQIATLMGYRSAGTISDLLRSRGHFSMVLNQLEINWLLQMLKTLPASKTKADITRKLKNIRSNEK
jgi:hypothetical protein